VGPALPQYLQLLLAISCTTLSLLLILDNQSLNLPIALPPFNTTMS